ncbi:MAG: hypothetical protein PHU62_08050 [Bacteroidales bacterium]|nr:hypothetical protein [Bacteroidales bacterium]MDD4634505.1 hypothetical protein [Bacteroidales bacterium]
MQKNILKVYVFNPDHDLALANGDENFFPPLSAQKFALDAQLLPLQCFKDQWVLNSDNFIVNSKGEFSNNFSEKIIFYPWGWNNAILKRLQNLNLGSSLLPSKQDVDKIRQLSHRKTAVEAMTYLQTRIKIKFPEIAQQLCSASEIENFTKNHNEVVFKAPWSGSGKGIIINIGKLNNINRNRCNKIIEKQGSIIAEKKLDVVQNFAMEFRCENLKTDFFGYSLFNTTNCTYNENILLPDNKIEILLSKYTSIETLYAIQSSLKKFITKNIAPFYSGYLGVDMFIYKEQEKYLLNPAVEINLRMTMGIVSKLFYDLHIAVGSFGKMQIIHKNNNNELFKIYKKNQQNFPLEINNGKIVRGFTSLCPVSETTNYGIFIHVQNSKIDY